MQELTTHFLGDGRILVNAGAIFERCNRASQWFLSRLGIYPRSNNTADTQGAPKYDIYAGGRCSSVQEETFVEGDHIF